MKFGAYFSVKTSCLSKSRIKVTPNYETISKLRDFKASRMRSIDPSYNREDMDRLIEEVINAPYRSPKLVKQRQNQKRLDYTCRLIKRT